MDEETMKHYREKGREHGAAKTKAFDLSIHIMGDFNYFSDRWNPAKMAYVIEEIKVLIELLKKELDYEPEEWEGIL